MHVLRMQILRNVGCHALFFPTADIHITGPGLNQVTSLWSRGNENQTVVLFVSLSLLQQRPLSLKGMVSESTQ